MPQILRLGLIGAVGIAIAAFTSVGLYATVAGGLFRGDDDSRPLSGAAPVVVTIQALPTATPAPATPIQPAGSLAATPSVEAKASGSASTPSSAAKPAVANAAEVAPGAANARPTPAATASHDGLAATVVELQRGWQPDGATLASGPRDNQELVTVLVQIVNRGAETHQFDDGDFALVADDGSRYGARPASAREPRLAGAPIVPGDQVRGWRTFEVAPGAAISRVQWAPLRPGRTRPDVAYYLALPR